MTNLREAAQQALAFTMRDFASLRDFEAAKAVLHDNLRAALAQQEEPCPNCASLEAQNTELDQKLAELEQAYQSGYNAGAAAERETIIQAMPGGHSVDSQWVCDMIRSRGNT